MTKIKRTVAGCIISLTLAVVFSFSLVRPAVVSSAQTRQTLGAFKYSTFDLVVPDPTQEQVAEFLLNPAVEQVFHVFIAATVISKDDNQTQDARLYLANNLADVEISPFNQNRLISKNNAQNGVFVDYVLAQKVGLKLGDSISFSIGTSSFSSTVSAIYEASGIHYNGCALIVYTQDMRDALPINRQYGMAFIKGNTTQDLLKASFSGYLPLGRQRAESEFSSSGEYNNYLTAFSSTNYMNELKTREFYLTNAEKLVTMDNSFAMSILSAIILSALMIGANIVLLFLSKERYKDSFKHGKSFSAISKFWYHTSIIEAAVGVVTFMLVIVLIPYSTYYASINMKLAAFFPSLVALLFAVIVNISCSYFALKRLHNIKGTN